MLTKVAFHKSHNDIKYIIISKYKCIYFKIFENVIYCFDGKATFSASLLQSSVSHDPSVIILFVTSTSWSTHDLHQRALLQTPLLSHNKLQFP